MQNPRTPAADELPEGAPRTIALPGISFDVDRGLVHLLLVSFGLVLLYAWMVTLPVYADSLYYTTIHETGTKPWHILAALHPRFDLTDEPNHVTALYRPVFTELFVPALQNLRHPAARVVVSLGMVLSVASVIYSFSYALTRCQDGAFVVAGFFAFHPTLFEAVLAGLAGVNATLAYLLVGLAVLICRRFVLRRSWFTALLVLTLAALGVFAWERLVLLPIALVFLALGWSLFDPRVSRQDSRLSLGARLKVQFTDRFFISLVGGALIIMSAYWLLRAIRYGALVYSHHGVSSSATGALLQGFALVSASFGLVPAAVPPHLGVHFGSMPLAARLVLLAYGLLAICLVVRSLRACTTLACLGLVFGGLLIIPNLASNVISPRYADFLVLGLTLTLSATPLFRRASSLQRLAWSLLIVAVMALGAATFELVSWNTPRGQLPDHYLTRSARVADAVQNAADTSKLLRSGQQVLLLSSFFNHDAMWVFNATPSRLGSFFAANFGLVRQQVKPFSPDRFNGQPAVIIDFNYRVEQTTTQVVAEVTEVRNVGRSEAVEWANPFDCPGDNVLIIEGQQLQPGGSDRQDVRVIFSGAQSFSVIELFSPYQEIVRHGPLKETRAYALVPPNAQRCQVIPEGLKSGSRISDVRLLPLQR